MGRRIAFGQAWEHKHDAVVLNQQKSELICKSFALCGVPEMSCRTPASTIQELTYVFGLLYISVFGDRLFLTQSFCYAVLVPAQKIRKRMSKPKRRRGIIPSPIFFMDRLLRTRACFTARQYFIIFVQTSYLT